MQTRHSMGDKGLSLTSIWESWCSSVWFRFFACDVSYMLFVYISFNCTVTSYSMQANICSSWKFVVLEIKWVGVSVILVLPQSWPQTTDSNVWMSLKWVVLDQFIKFTLHFLAAIESLTEHVQSSFIGIILFLMTSNHAVKYNQTNLQDLFNMVKRWWEEQWV